MARYWSEIADFNTPTSIWRLRWGDPSFSRSRDINGAAKFKMGHVTLTTPTPLEFCRDFWQRNTTVPGLS